ncbi:ead/Ea22-like family protein [Pseudomonas aeruginosa]|uniref:ead/Ea22-like family protein n=1 Tax=Pseudomonas aeruginosa TaxID=287 RepID=UPI004046AFFC
MTDHAELRRVAALAHPDAEWFIARNLDHQNIDKPAASFIATATPKTVLALLDEIDRLKAENDRLRQGMKGDYDIDAWLDWSKEKERIKSENEALRGALQAVEAEVDGNIRPLTRDLVNMVSGLKNGSHPNDIYEHCDDIERIIGAALEGDKP